MPSSLGSLARLVLLLALLHLPGAGLLAQNHIVADRPGLGTGSFVVPPSVLQFEAGAQYANVAGSSFYSFGQFLLRFGLRERLEIQGLGNSLEVRRGKGLDREGFQDLGVGAKLNLLARGPREANLSLQAQVAFPSGDEEFSEGTTASTVSLLADLTLSPAVGLGANLGASGLVGDAEDRLFLTLTPSASLPGRTPLDVYGGYAGFFADSGDLHYAEGGITWLLNPDLQLDLNGGVELTSGDPFVGVGLATRWFFDSPGPGAPPERRANLRTLPRR